MKYCTSGTSRQSIQTMSGKIGQEDGETEEIHCINQNQNKVNEHEGLKV